MKIESSSKDDREEAPASAPAEESDTEVIIKSFSMKDLRNMSLLPFRDNDCRSCAGFQD